MSGLMSRPSRRYQSLLADIHDAIPALHQRARDAADAIAGCVVGPVVVAVAPWAAEVICPHGVPGQSLARVVVTAIVGTDVQPRRSLRLVEPQRNSALVGG